MSRARRVLRRVKHRTVTPVAIIAATLAYIMRHPANRGERTKVLIRSVRAWVRYKRTGEPVPAALGKRSIILTQPRCLSHAESAPLYGNPPDYWETTLLQAVLRPGDSFVDVGANIGVYSLLAAERGASVVAIEPGTAARELLDRNVRMNRYNDLVTVHPVAAGATRRAIYPPPEQAS